MLKAEKLERLVRVQRFTLSISLGMLIKEGACHLKFGTCIKIFAFQGSNYRFFFPFSFYLLSLSFFFPPFLLFYLFLPFFLKCSYNFKPWTLAQIWEGTSICSFSVNLFDCFRQMQETILKHYMETFNLTLTFEWTL